MYRYLFGPVPSRRLGMSLGVDLVPRKVCSLDCVYCEVGKTTHTTLERKEYIPVEEMEAELSHYFANSPDPDYITFSGSGEPALNSQIGRVLRFIKENKPEVPVAVLTNGTLFSDPLVREAIRMADLVLPSLDAATSEVFEKINRPARGLTVEGHIAGIVEFKKTFKGKMWLEVFILPGYNDHPQELHALKEAILQIEPDEVQLNTLDRPGTLPGLRGATMEELHAIAEGWGLDKLRIIAAAPAARKRPSYRNDTETAILETIARRPCTQEDLAQILGVHVAEVGKYLRELESRGLIRAAPQARGVFYRLVDQ